MASACVNMAVNNFPSLSWLSPTTTSAAATTTTTTSNAAGDFEFHLLDDSVSMLPADELFFDGKLLPLHFPKHPPSSSSPSENLAGDPKLDADGGDGGGDVTVLFSPKAPRCSSRWREILGLKTKPKTTMTPSKKTTSSDASSLTAPLLQRPSSDVSTSRRSLSLSSSSSSSSSGREHEDAALHHHHLLLPRLSLDEQRKPREETHRHASRQRPPQLKTRGVSMDSPRMNPAGKIVFQSLERSSSSPSTFSGGPRYKYKGMERSYSANVRVTRVLNVPNGFGLGHLFSSSSSSSSNSQKKEKDNNSHNGRSERRRVHSHG